MHLTKLTSGDIALDKSTDFAIYSFDRKLLLQKGHVVASEGLLERLFRLGYREGAEPGVGVRSPRDASSAVRPAADTGKPQLLFTTASVAGTKPARADGLPAGKATFPRLQHKVEFFHLTSPGAPEPIKVELVGVVGEHALIVRGPDDGPALDLSPEQQYEARMFTGTRLFKFTTKPLPASAGPGGCVYLDYPETIAQATVRKHQRVATSITGKLLSGEYMRPLADVTVENVSSTGAAVSVAENFLTVGQSARLSMNLTVDHRIRPVMVFVEVRNHREENGRTSYGLEFVRMTEDVRRDFKDFVLFSLAFL